MVARREIDICSSAVALVLLSVNPSCWLGSAAGQVVGSLTSEE